mmetsp:Transcript_26342/g.81012  ORF Transcript_26342/g.81012 Transcript_26342/m.81012 type:complete len:173 (+) Transcript_26342:433-951(+)
MKLGQRRPTALPAGGELFVREVSTVREDHYVKPRLLSKLRELDPSAASSFRATSRCVTLFQEIDGVDVLLLALYVYEYGPEAPLPNRRRLYVSYLDSVSSLRPKTARTAIYREFLVGFLVEAKDGAASTGRGAHLGVSFEAWLRTTTSSTPPNRSTSPPPPLTTAAHLYRVL